MGESLFYLWCHSFFNGERGGNALSNLTLGTKCGFEFDPLSLKKYRVADGGFFSSLAFLVKKSGKRAAGSGHINLTLFKKREKTEGKVGRRERRF